jgi:hypothetical protein
VGEVWEYALIGGRDSEQLLENMNAAAFTDGWEAVTVDLYRKEAVMKRRVVS